MSGKKEISLPSENCEELYEILKKSIRQYVYIHKIIPDSYKEDFVHDFAVKLLTKIYLVDQKKQNSTAKPENLLQNWAISTVRRWQLDMKKEFYKTIHHSNSPNSELGMDTYSDRIGENFENTLEDGVAVNFIRFEKILDIRLLIENNSQFNRYDKIIFNYHYIQDEKLKNIGPMIGLDNQLIVEKHKSLIDKLRDFKDYL